MNIPENLRQLGLSRSETTVYLHLLKNSPATPPNVSRETKIARTNCYNILNSLVDKGLAKEENKGKRKTYTATEPGAFLKLLDEKRGLTKQLLPFLQSLYMGGSDRPEITQHEGLDGIKEIYELSLGARQIVCLSSGKVGELLPDYWESCLKEIKQRHLVLHELISKESRKEAIKIKAALKASYDYRVLPLEYSTPDMDILIFGDYVAFLDLGKKPSGTLIKSPNLANTIGKVLFLLKWML